MTLQTTPNVTLSEPETLCFNALYSALESVEDKANCIYRDGDAIDEKLLSSTVKWIIEDLAKGEDVTQALVKRHLSVTDEIASAFMVFTPEEVESESLLTALDALHASKTDKQEPNPAFDTLLKSLKGDVEAGEIRTTEKLVNEYNKAFNTVLGLTVEGVRTLLNDAYESSIKRLREEKRKAITSIRNELLQALLDTNTDLSSIIPTFEKRVEVVKEKKVETDTTHVSEKTSEQITQEKAQAEEAVKFIAESFKPEQRVALITDVPLNHFLMISDYTSNRDAQKRAQSAKAPTLKNKKGVLPHLVGSLVAPQQKLVKVLYITKEDCPQLWGAVEKHCKDNNLPCTLPYIIGDAHCRKYAWQIKDEDGVDGWKLERPDAVDVMIFSQGVDGKPFTDAGVFTFVGAECSKFTAFSNKEENEVSLIESKLEAKSAFVLRQWKDAVNGIFQPGSDLKDVRTEYKAELMMIDALNLKASYPESEYDKPTRARVSAGIKAAILESAKLCRIATVDFSTAVSGFWADFFAIFKDGDDAEDVQRKETGSLVDWIEETGHKNRSTGKVVDAWSGSFNDAVYLEAVYWFSEWLKKQK